MRTLFKSATVPGTPVRLDIEILPADRKLAKARGDERGSGRWETLYVVSQHANGATYVGPATLEIGRRTLQEARAVANDLWLTVLRQRNSMLRDC